MSTLSDLLLQVQKQSPQLAADLQREIKSLEQRRAFGLNFERHSPESVQLPRRPIRKGDKVRFLAERSKTPETVDQRLWLVTRLETLKGGRVAHLARQDAFDAAPETTTRAIEDLAVVAESRDPIYPGLVSTGSVTRGGDKPFHTVINAENFHALQTLLFTHEGKIDAIYIDPPYNTGARDWKYNNDYVDGEDKYRHSKWLAFMERRLKIARRLLNPSESVLIVTIDEKEYLRLGLLLEQTFPEARIQMISAVINPAGVTRPGAFARTDEYIYFVFFGTAVASPLPLGDEWRVNPSDKRTTTILWSMLIRTGTNARRVDRPKLFYPIFVSADGTSIDGIGEPLPEGVERSTIDGPPGSLTIWPIRKDGTEGNWQISPVRLHEAYAQGFVRFGRISDRGMAISYLKSGEQKKVLDGAYIVTGRREDGSVIAENAGDSQNRIIPTTAWRIPAHDSSRNGSNLLKSLLPDRKFPFPKSLYAVEDSLRFFLAGKPDAVTVDFFAGSGTTAHATMRLNRQDGGRRTTILITNNEVSAEEQSGLRARGLRPGDDEWESLGICDYITQPRIRAAVTGLTPNGDPVEGAYRYVDPGPISEGLEENVEFFTMTYEAQRSVAHHRAFGAVAPLLWLKAGAVGRRIDKPTETFDVAEAYGVLFDLDHTAGFIEQLNAATTARVAFIVTDDDRGFQMVCADLPPRVEAVRLYSSYLTNFTINVGRE